jgi:hypothetical protein
LAPLGFVLALLSAAAAAGNSPPTSDLLGRWHGTSICTKADWNQACHDEEALYDFAPGVAPGHLVLHAYKIVNREPVFMGDLDVTWDDTLHAWAAEFSNERVHIRWIFEPHGDSLDGRMVFLPTMRTGRVLHVSRQRPLKD